MNKKVATIESMTGGALSAHFVKKPGASKWYLGSYIVYSYEFKKMLGLNVNNGVINQEFALEMVKFLKRKLNADLNIAITGNAGPNVQDQKPIGLVFVAINEKVFKLKFKGNREQIIKQTIEFVENKLW